MMMRCSSFDLLAQHFGLALLQAHGALAVRAGELHARQQLGMALEEAGCAQQVFGDVVFGDGGWRCWWSRVRRECRSGLRTRSRRGQRGTCKSASWPLQAMVSRPPRVCTSTRASSSPRRMPAATAAQAPVPQARVSPARARTRAGAHGCGPPPAGNPRSRCGKAVWHSMMAGLRHRGRCPRHPPVARHAGCPWTQLLSNSSCLRLPIQRKRPFCPKPWGTGTRPAASKGTRAGRTAGGPCPR